MEERATLRHKTVSKKLRFYDQTNTKESEVRRTQNLESQKLRAKVDMNKDQGNLSGLLTSGRVRRTRD